MEDFSSYFKYCSDNTDVINSIFRENKVRFTQPWGMNDPLEFNPTIKINWEEKIYQGYELDGIFLPSTEFFLRLQAIEPQINAYGILSLTKQPFSFAMWSKYANGHKGFVLELKSDFNKHSCMRSKDGSENFLSKVEYVDEYHVDLANLFNHDNEIPLKTLRDEIIFKKTLRWKEEQEYRIIRPLTDCPYYKPMSNYSHRDNLIYLFDFSLDCVESIIFGACMSAQIKKIIVDYCKGTSIRFYQAVVIRNQKSDDDLLPGKVTFFPLTHFETVEEAYEIKPQMLIIDEGQSIYQDRKKIEKISDLPYYEDNKEIVDLMFSELKKGLNR